MFEKTLTKWVMSYLVSHNQKLISFSLISIWIDLKIRINLKKIWHDNSYVNGFKTINLFKANMWRKQDGAASESSSSHGFVVKLWIWSLVMFHVLRVPKVKAFEIKPHLWNNDDLPRSMIDIGFRGNSPPKKHPKRSRGFKTMKIGHFDACLGPSWGFQRP